MDLLRSSLSPYEYSSPEGTRENNAKEMTKKNYKTPKMKEVKVNVEQKLLAGSACDALYSAGGDCGGFE